MRLAPSFVGVEKSPMTRFQYVVIRFDAKSTGSPSVPAESGKRSTSSQSRMRTGRDASPAGLLAPAITRRPPGKILFKIVLLLSLVLTSKKRLESAGVSRIMGAMRVFEKSCAISIVGWIIMMVQGSRWANRPMTLFMMSDFPTCEHDFTTTRWIPGCVKASMMSFW